MAAVACLGALPYDNAAAPAIAYLDDINPEVRQQAMASFSQRNVLLTDDMLFKRLHDENATIRESSRLDSQDPRTDAGADQSRRSHV